jgi:hypothetical protein
MAKKLNIERILAAQLAAGINPEEVKLRLSVREQLDKDTKLLQLKNEVLYKSRLLECVDDIQETLNTLSRKGLKLYNRFYKGGAEKGNFDEWRAMYEVISHPILYLRNIVLHKGIENLGDIDGLIKLLSDRIQLYNKHHYPSDKIKQSVINDTKHILKNLTEYIPDIIGSYDIIYVFKARYVKPKHRVNIYHNKRINN